MKSEDEVVTNVLIPIWNTKRTVIHPALNIDKEKVLLSQFMIYLDGETEKEYLTLIGSDKKFCIIKEEEDFTKNNYKPLYFPNKLDNRWSPDSIKHFLNGSCPVVTMKDTFETVKAEIKEYIDLPDDRMYDFMACWIIGTYFHPMFNSFPYVYLNAMKRSGKTKLLTLAYCMAFNAKFTLSLTPATLFRLVQGNRCTIVMDEEEKLNDKDKIEYRSLLLGGYKKGMKVPRAQEGKKKSFEVNEYEVYSPKIMANISGIEDVLEDRCITLILLRTLSVGLANREIDINDEKWQMVRDKLYVNLMVNYNAVIRSYGLLSDHFSSVGSVGCEGSVGTMGVRGLLINNDMSIIHESPTHPTLTTLGKLKTIRARDLELWMPILAIGMTVDDTIFNNLVDFALKNIAEKETESVTESNDSVLIESLIDIVKDDDYISTRDLIDKIANYLDIDIKDKNNGWLNGVWLGRAMKRLGFVNKRRVARGVEYRLAPESVKNIAMRAKVGLDKYVKQKTLEVNQNDNNESIQKP